MDDPTLVLPGELPELFLRAGRLTKPLWVCGSLDGLAAPAVAVVGARAPSGGGRRLAFTTAKRLGEAGVCVVSGLALGIDAAAHEGALAAGAPTIGVLGGGHRRFFPKSNAGLADRIVAGGGAVVSPYAPDHEAWPSQFLQRNGVVAALADGVVVVEAAARSGALNTASHAADLGIPVMAFPGDVDRAKVAGCLALIRDGATLVRDATDVLEALGLQPSPAADVRAALGEDERAIVRALADGELDFDALLVRSRCPPGLLASRLVELEVRGIVESRTGDRYALT
ncbi:MAG: DNA-processing protein DprA [Vulcanimicrobiaceae bacterium]